MNYFPKNTLTTYTTKLHHEISLCDDWEVSLTEIILPKNWYNVGKNQYVMMKCYVPQHDLVFTSPKIFIPSGYYANIESLVALINTALSRFVENYNKWIDFNQYRDLDYVMELEHFIEQGHYLTKMCVTGENQIEVSIDAQCEILFGDDLLDILGFEEEDRSIFRNTNVLDFRGTFTVRPFLEANRQMLYVYCDILENVSVGDTLAPLLRIINVDGQRDSLIHKIFDQPRYLPVQKKNFDTLEINIRDGLGREVPFDKGSLIVTLHFRRANTPYFLS